MKRATLILAIVLIAIGVVGLVATSALQSASFYSNAAVPWDAYGMMGPGMMDGAMMGRGYGYRYAPGTAPITLDRAATQAQQYVASLNNSDLALDEIMEFSNNFYVRVKERSSGVNAFELLVDKYRGTISPEPGPNMMWNARYSPMSRMMGGWFAPSAQNTVTPAQAKDKAQQYLEIYLKGAQVADEADAFYGYYTIDVLHDTKTIGMLSVNGTTGTVWYHTWHGTFVAEKEF
jgi:hypothetical protein